jgi:hypothetical protein
VLTYFLNDFEMVPVAPISIIIIIIFSGSAAQRGLWLPRIRGFTQNDAP